ncbi:UDP-N-acetylmuramoyl-L-alanine--D-glutamate ligase [Magnetovirga frankeli]|uniref:UDP-N-acetylmuramoyl-L-alanine--D-glutamate ligase n=1 Tax=Magnetovirga frankeli TaxID=947516 RepID=UPI00129388C0|nr:UDP-N-acetylmuramoyl-L-alanine--D-glutamate ligase [gamma proteobacterium SS-5]
MLARTQHQHPLQGQGHFSARPLQGKVLVVGLGKTGLSVVRYLMQRGHEVAVTDSRAQPPGLEACREHWPDLPLFVGGFEASAFAAADSLVVSPGVSLEEPLIAQAIRQGKPVLGDVELFARAVQAPVVAITGSNGKSTVTSLLAEMAKAAGIQAVAGANLGEPVLDLLGQKAELFILELSSFQLDCLSSLRPRLAALLNISADHMDRYPDLAAYRDAKARVFLGAEAGLINRDDPLIQQTLPLGLACRSFGLDEPEGDDYGLRQIDGRPWLCRGQQALLACAELLIPGRHNWANALAAWALAEGLGLDDVGIAQVLRRFTGLPHRTQLVRQLRGVRWYNDSKGTNPGATLAALQGLAEQGEGRVLLIAGGDCKGADFSELAPAVAAHARAVILIGRDAPLIEAALAGHTPLLHAADMKQAVAQAQAQARPGDSVLLSPACASLDMFDNYMHRGDVFIRAVEGLPT